MPLPKEHLTTPAHYRNAPHTAPYTHSARTDYNRT